MRALIVVPAELSIRVVNISGDLASLQEVVQGYIEGIYPGYFHADFAGVHGYVNEEGAFRPEFRDRVWSVPGYETLLGPAVFVGTGPGGTDQDCPLTALQLARHVRWHFG